MSKEAKHTPGPWILGYTKEGGDLSVWPIEAQHGGKHYPVCKVAPPENTTNEDHANARLIAAAPDLLKVLLEAKEKLGQMTIGILPTGIHLTLTRIDVIQKAIEAP